MIANFDYLEKSASNCLTFGSSCHADHRAPNDAFADGGNGASPLPFQELRVVWSGGDGSVGGGDKSADVGECNCDFDDGSVGRDARSCGGAGQCNSDFAIPG
jgi:hypothetical protein